MFFLEKTRGRALRVPAPQKNGHARPLKLDEQRSRCGSATASGVYRPEKRKGNAAKSPGVLEIRSSPLEGGSR